MVIPPELASRLEKLEEQAAKCIRCGVCQSVCPVFSQTGMESDVARGRLFMISNIRSHLERDPHEILARLEKCLLCSSCQSACPPDIPIMDIYREAREIVADIAGVTDRPVAGHLLPPGIAGGKGYWQLRGDVKYLARDDMPRVVIFPGCLGQYRYHGMLDACVAALRLHGVGVTVPRDTGCCGKSCSDAGDPGGLFNAVMHNLDVLRGYDFDYLLSPCASCTSAIRLLWPGVASKLDGAACSSLAEICSRTMDVSVFLVDVLGVEPADDDSGAELVTYHDPCHLRKDLGHIWQPRTLLMASPDCSYVEMPYAEQCCGCGGRFSAAHPEYSEKIGREKMEFAMSTGATVLATGCSWCRWQLERLAEPVGLDIRHPVEVYAAHLARDFMPDVS